MYRRNQILLSIVICLLMIIIITGCEWYFAQYWITITVKEGEGTTNPVPGRHGPYSFNQSISVTAIPAAGWELQKIIENHDGDVSEHTESTIHVIMEASAQDVEVDVYFQRTIPNYNITLYKYYENTQVPCEGTVTLLPVGGTYEQGTTVTITCTPSAGMSFINMDIYGQTSERTWVLMKSASTSTTTIDTNCNIVVEAFFRNN